MSQCNSCSDSFKTSLTILPSFAQNPAMVPPHAHDESRNLYGSTSSALRQSHRQSLLFSPWIILLQLHWPLSCSLNASVSGRLPGVFPLLEMSCRQSVCLAHSPSLSLCSYIIVSVGPYLFTLPKALGWECELLEPFESNCKVSFKIF